MLGFWAGWDDEGWRHLASEEVLLDGAITGKPCLFAYTFVRPTLVIGYGQSPSPGIRLDACREQDVRVLRRMTGGTGVLYTGDLALSLALPSGHPWSRSIASLYEGFVGAIQAGLASTGVHTERARPDSKAAGPRSPICFEGRSAETLLLGGRKLFGCAQTRRKESVLVHGALLLGLDSGLQSRVYGVPQERIEALLGHVPKGSGRTAPELATTMADAIALALGEPSSVPERPPPLPDTLLARQNDPRWIIL